MDPTFGFKVFSKKYKTVQGVVFSQRFQMYSDKIYNFTKVNVGLPVSEISAALSIPMSFFPETGVKMVVLFIVRH